METQFRLAEHSADFYRVENSRVVDYTGDTAVIPFDMWNRLTYYVSEPLIQLDGNRYWLTPEERVPADTIAIPSATTGEKNAEPMLAKNSKLRELLHTGAVEKP